MLSLFFEFPPHTPSLSTTIYPNTNNMAKKNTKNRLRQPNVTVSDDTTATDATTTITDSNLPTNTPQSDARLPAETCVTFATFIAVATMGDITEFLQLAATRNELGGENLVNLWERAFDHYYGV